MMRAMPFSSLHVLLRVFAKSVALLLIANVVCLASGLDPLARLYTFNLWGLVGHGRPRLYDLHDNGVDPLPVEAMLASHAIAYTPKAPDEYRVVVLGDSAILGWNLPEDQHVSAQLTAHGLRINGKRLTAYNLAYPHPNWAKDVLILDAALRYQPDLIIWFITMIADENAQDTASTNPIWNVNRARLRQLAREYGLHDWYNARMLPEPAWCTWIAICAPESFLAWSRAFTYPFIETRWDYTQSSRIGSAPIPARARHVIGEPSSGDQFPNDNVSFLSVGQTMANKANVALLYVNEPILIGSGPNSDVNYNYYYERALYDFNRRFIADAMRSRQAWYLDLWNAIPKERFTDTAIHMDAAGWKVVADRIALELDRLGVQR